MRCLIEGSPWHVSKPDLETQLQGVMRGVDVTDVHMPENSLGDVPMTYTCVDGVLNLQAQGSPFINLFR